MARRIRSTSNQTRSGETASLSRPRTGGLFVQAHPRSGHGRRFLALRARSSSTGFLGGGAGLLKREAFWLAASVALGWRRRLGRYGDSAPTAGAESV